MPISKGQILSADYVWDKTTRWFHWLNVICILGLVVLGTIILNGSVIGVSAEGKVLLKTVHVLTGYVFFANLIWRLLWAFIGSPSARWRSILPGGENYASRLKEYVIGLRNGEAPGYLGHNPAGRIMITLLLGLLLVQGSTGLVLAGTDIYFPPFGSLVAEWVTAGDPVRLANLAPGSKEFVDLQSYDEMRTFRKPFITVHLYVFYFLLVSIFIHILSVVMSEIVERSGIISAMFSGRKCMSKPAVDRDEYPSSSS